MKKTSKSLKNLREIIGKTQKQFAAMVGVSIQLVKMVETRQQPFTESFARKIKIATGAEFSKWMFDNKKRKIWREQLPDGEIRYGSNKKDYTRECFEQHLRSSQSAESAIDEIREPLIDLFVAASKPGVAGMKHRLPMVKESLWDWMRETNKAFNLGLKL